MQKISYVIPCYRSTRTIRKVVDEIGNTMSKQKDLEYEIILVNDCSPDDLWPLLCDMAREDPHIVGVNLAKNFGQHSALMAGYHYVTGDIVISLDDDGQTPADEAMKFVDKINEGYDVVYAKYARNMESVFRRFGSWVNLKMAEYLVNKPKDIAIQSYFAAKRFIIDEILKYEHAYPYIVGLVFRTTQNVANVEVNHRSRAVGRSGFTIKKLLSLWMNGFTAFSVKPLRLATLIGIVSSAVGTLLGVWSVANYFIDPSIPRGYSSLIAIIVFFGGLTMLVLGMIGEYIGRMYMCINNSPQFVVKETTNQCLNDNGAEKDPVGENKGN